MIARLGCLLAIAIALCGCGTLLPTAAEQQGDCTLVLRDANGRAMTAPYRLSPADYPDRGYYLMHDADGWGLTSIETIDPAGGRTFAGMDADSFNGGMSGSALDRPGTWHIRLSDRHGCVHSFAIEVTP